MDQSNFGLDLHNHTILFELVLFGNLRKPNNVILLKYCLVKFLMIFPNKISLKQYEHYAKYMLIQTARCLVSDEHHVWVKKNLAY